MKKYNIQKRINNVKDFSLKFVLFLKYYVLIFPYT